MTSLPASLADRLADFVPPKARVQGSGKPAPRIGGLINTSCPQPEDLEGVTALGYIRTGWVWVTPKMAAAWLTNNHGNRAVSKPTVQAYARDMKSKNWALTHEGIAFDDKNHLIDGQHRLHAVIKANVKVRMMVTTGLSHKIEGKAMMTMDCVDRGRPRSVSDQLKIQHGMKDTSIIAAVCANLGRLCCEERTRRLSVGQTLEILAAFKDPLLWVIDHRSKHHGLRQAGVLAAFVFAMACHDGSDAQRMQQRHDDVILGRAKLPSPLAQLHAFLTGEQAKLLSRGSDRGLAELVLHALWLEAQGRTVPELGLSPEGLEHFRDCQAERVAAIAKMFALPEVES